jgi:uncharacterized protein YkwD
MKLRSRALAGLFFLLSANSALYAQATSGPNTTSRLTNLEAALARFLESDDDDSVPAPGRPRIVEKVSGVKASVIVKNVEVSRAVFDLMNQKRVENGRPALAWSDDLARVASLHSENMAEYSFFSHRGLDSKLVSQRADDAQVGRWRAIGENIAYHRGYKDPAAKAIELWLDSPGHRQNMLNPDWKETAIGVAIAADGSYYFTQVFLKK